MVSDKHTSSNIFITISWGRGRRQTITLAAHVDRVVRVTSYTLCCRTVRPELKYYDSVAGCLMRRSLKKILGPQLLVNASNIHPTVAFIQPVYAAVCLQRHNFSATSSACFAAGGAQSSQSPRKRTQHSRRRRAQKISTVPTPESPTKSFDTPSFDKSVRPTTVNDQCQIWNETQHRIRASSIPQYAFSVLIKLKLAGDHFQTHWSGLHS